MNTETLQETFPSIYKDLFSRCSIVTSTSGIFYWTGEYVVNFGGPAITQKLPVRVFVGIQPYSMKSAVKFEDAQYYIPSNKKFETIETDAFTLKEYERYMEDLLKRLTGRDDFPGFKVHIIYEVPKSSGFSARSTFASALMAAVFLYIGKMNMDQYWECQRMPIDELIHKSEIFDLLFRESAKLSAFIYGGISSASAVFSSLVNSRYPLVYFIEKRFGLLDEKDQENFISEYMSKDIKKFDDIDYWAYDMGQFYKFNKNPIWPLDFGLIYSGNMKPAGRTKRMLMSLENSFRKLVLFTKESFCALEKDKAQPFFCKMVREDQGSMWDSYLTVLTMVSLEVLHGFKHMFWNGDEESFKNFFKSVNLYGDIINLLDPGSYNTDYISNFLKEDTKKISDENGVATHVEGAGKGGDILFIAPYGGLRSHIYKTMEKLRRNTGKNIYIDYLSWEDGYGEKGLLVEQNIKAGVFSKFISKGALQFRHMTQKGEIHEDVYSREDFDIRQDKMDILLDPFEHKIKIRGHELNSKILPSTRTTIEILDILIEHIGQDVGNEDLPRSSYSTNRNDLQSKIITPLQKVIKKELGYELDLKITGSLNKFYVKLKPGKYHIHTLKNIL